MNIIRKHSTSFGRRGAFTLVELLVVIAIIAMLVALLMSAVWGFKGRARQVQSNATALAVATAIRGYHTEYHRWPVPAGLEPVGGTWTNNNYLVMKMLLPNDPSGKNTHSMPFWENTNNAIMPVNDGFGDWYTIQIDVGNNQVVVSSPHSSATL